MIRLNFAGKIHRLYVGVDGAVHWGAYGGGSGMIEGYRGPLGSLGVPDGLTVTGGLAVSPEVYNGVNRLSVECRWSDGGTRQTVVDADSFHIITPWTSIDTTPAEAVPAASSAGFVPHHHGTDAGAPA